MQGGESRSGCAAHGEINEDKIPPGACCAWQGDPGDPGPWVIVPALFPGRCPAASAALLHRLCCPIRAVSWAPAAVPLCLLPQPITPAYPSYINKNGGGAGALAFLIVISILNAARNSLSFFLLLIVSMGLSVVTPSLGDVMSRIRILTGLHFIFGGELV